MFYLNVVFEQHLVKMTNSEGHHINVIFRTHLQFLSTNKYWKKKPALDSIFDCMILTVMLFNFNTHFNIYSNLKK